MEFITFVCGVFLRRTIRIFSENSTKRTNHYSSRSNYSQSKGPDVSDSYPTDYDESKLLGIIFGGTLYTSSIKMCRHGKGTCKPPTTRVFHMFASQNFGL